MDLGEIKPGVRFAVYVVVACVGFVFFFFNRHPMLRMLGGAIGVIMVLALIAEPLLHAWDRKRGRDGSVDLHDGDR